MSGFAQLKFHIPAIALAFLYGCNQFNEYDCAKVTLAVVANLENNTGLTASELKLANYLYETVPARGSFMVHSYDEVFMACQKIKYDPNSPF